MIERALFRGKHIDEKRWYYGSLIVEDENNYFIVGKDFGEVQVEPETVGQFTGLRGRDGGQVWEGDMVYAEMLGGHKGKLIVGWGDRGFIQIEENGYRYADWFPVIEVFGNIHDTPGFVMPEMHDAAPPNEDNDPWRCRNCGSLDVQAQGWVNANTGEVISYNDCDRGDYYCEDCEENDYLIRESELMKTIEDWFANHLQPDDDEVISGLNSDDFTSEEEFEAACKKLWDARDNESKIDIWHELTRDKSNDSE